MHPAYSVIVFTTASGAGYGLLIWLALFVALGAVPVERWFGFVGLALALGLVTAGLVSSTFHLGRPERSWRAFSQWSTSWLSREGVLSVATYLPAGLLGIGWVFFESLWGVGLWLAISTILGALATVYCTGMIYASLRTIPQWNLAIVPLAYIALALASGAVLFNLVLFLFGFGAAWAGWLAIALLAVAMVVKAVYWMTIDGMGGRYTAESATGLGRFGKVRPFEAAHSRPNFVMREMGFKVARKHARKLRGYVFILGFTLPIAASLASALTPDVWGLIAALVATVSLAAGLLIERWLFFGEAVHVVNLYYGAETA